jgi:hypothetical protein
MKRTVTLIIAMALVFGLSQCKKNDVQPVANNGMQITLNATYGGEKTVFNDGTFTWNTSGTEYIYVGCSEKDFCIGELSATCNRANELVFSGTITYTPSNGATLYFFYLGNGQHTGLYAHILDFSNQTSGNVTDFHVAVGSAIYNGSTTFNATLQPIMAIAKFDLSSFGDENIYVYGNDVYAAATVDYSTGTLTKKVQGYINIGTGSATKYVALIPSTDSQTTIKFTSNSKDGSKVFNNGIQTAKFYATNNNGALAISATQVSNGTVPGLFTVERGNITNSETQINITTKMVRFAKGNLRYKYGTGWRFADHQYDICQTTNGTWNMSDVWVDLFGWGTWGTGKNPTATSTSYTDYQWSSDFTGTLDGHDDWFTLSNDQWFHILSNNQKGTATIVVDGKQVHGVVILPDNSTLSISISAGWSANSYSESEWTTDMEANGAVFLPAAGHRYGLDVSDIGEYGGYWSSTNAASDGARFLYLSSSTPYMRNDYRYLGYNVRLVR